MTISTPVLLLTLLSCPQQPPSQRHQAALILCLPDPMHMGIKHPLVSVLTFQGVHILKEKWCLSLSNQHLPVAPGVGWTLMSCTLPCLSFMDLILCRSWSKHSCCEFMVSRRGVAWRGERTCSQRSSLPSAPSFILHHLLRVSP